MPVESLCLAGPARAVSVKTLTASNTTATLNIFQLTGSVRILQLYGVVTGTIGANHTASAFGLTDGTNQVPIATAAATPLSAAPTDSIVLVDGIKPGASPDPAVVIVANLPALGMQASGAPIFQPFEVVQHSGTATYIGYQFATTDTPTSGQITFFVVYERISGDGALVPV